MMVQLNEILATFQGQSLGMDRESQSNLWILGNFWGTTFFVILVIYIPVT